MFSSALPTLRSLLWSLSFAKLLQILFTPMMTNEPTHDEVQSVLQGLVNYVAKQRGHDDYLNCKAYLEAKRAAGKPKFLDDLLWELVADYEQENGIMGPYQ